MILEVLFVNTSIVIAAAAGIIRRCDNNLLAVYWWTHCFNKALGPVLDAKNGTMAKEGSKKVPIVGIDDKRQIAFALAAAMTGKLSPLQLVYQGKTKASLPTMDFPADWYVTFSPNHWCSEIAMNHYV